VIDYDRLLSKSSSSSSHCHILLTGRVLKEAQSLC